MEVIENHLLIFIFDLQTACRKGLNKRLDRLLITLCNSGGTFVSENAMHPSLQSQVYNFQ